MLRIPFGRRGLAVAFSSAVAAAVLAAVPAHAASHQGDLLVKGPGSSANTQGPNVTLTGAPGETVTYTFSVKNTGTTLAQYRIQEDGALPMDVYKGSLILTPLAGSADGYYTVALNPGQSEVFSAKVKVPSVISVDDQSMWENHVNLFATDGAFLDAVYLYTNQSVATGTGAYSATLTQGGQKPIGGMHSEQAITGPTIAMTGNMTYTLVLRNKSTWETWSPNLRVDTNSCGGFTVAVKNGITDITGSLTNGNVRNFVLKPGQQVSLAITVKGVNVSRDCAYFIGGVSVSSMWYHPGSQYLQFVTNTAA